MNFIISTIIDIIDNSSRDILNCKSENVQAYSTVSFFKFKYIRVKNGPKVKYIAIPYHLTHMLSLFNITQTKPSDGWQRIYINNTDDVIKLSNLVLEIYDYCELKTTGELFDCCSKYIECSDAKTCVQKDEKWHKGCTYRVNLAQGRIFYGANSIVKI